MKLFPFLASSIVVFTLTNFLHAEDAPAQHPFLCCDYNGNQVCIVAKDGSIEWRVEAKSPQDCWLMPGGNILFCHAGGAREVARDKKVVWEYKAPPGAECHACQPLPDGRVLVVECGSSRLVEVDAKGQIAKELKLNTATKAIHNQFRGARKTAEGHYLVCFKGEHKVVELDGEGKTLRELPVPGDVHAAVLLPGKHLLVTCGDGHKVVELDDAGKVIWELNENDLPGNPLRLMAGCQRLPNGNTLFCNYLGHGFIGKQPMVFELTPGKKVVWEFADHAHFKTINQIQALDFPGDAIKGEILR
jgi:outer membrane protein assembly factor BamB